MPPLLHTYQAAAPNVADERLARAERRADFLARVLQGTMALEGQGLPEDVLDRLKHRMLELLLARDA